ncbi:MAG TPA: DUF6112 family protein [Acidimicrobiales bacterium]|nr:DUF6112 family protein [Acidimicrobiales bacterium]
MTPHVNTRLVSATTIVNLVPNAAAIPGASTLQTLADGIGWWALIASLVGLVLGAAAWALGSHTNNYQYSSSGRRAVLVSGIAALVIGAAPILVNFLFSAGKGF